MANAGFIAVLSDTAATQPNLQRDDGIALHPALQIANSQSASFWFDSLDIARMAICGHSMGGGNTVRVLAENPGYQVGIGFAPWNGIFPDGTGTLFSTTHASAVTTPLLILHGEGDTVLDWQTTAQLYFDETTSYSDTLAFVLLDEACDHGNVTRLDSRSSPVDHAIFDRSMTTAIGWLRAHLLGDFAGLEEAIGPALLDEPHLSQLAAAVRSPHLWSVGETKVGETIGFRLSGELGGAWLFASPFADEVETLYGVLRVDAGSLISVNEMPITAIGPQSTPITIPNTPSLVGVTAWLQGIAHTDGFGPRLSNPTNIILTM